MKKQFWSTVKHVISRCDIILYVCDARSADQSRNKDVERMLARSRKPTIVVLNKTDLATTRTPIDGFAHVVYLSVKHRRGIRVLRKKIKELAESVRFPQPRIGVIGYPNVGKSSLLNLLKGSRSSSVSAQPGHTKGMQYIAVGPYLFMDTPGVITKKEQETSAAIKLGAVNPTNKEERVEQLLEEDEATRNYFSLAPGPGDELLEQVAITCNFLKKGGAPDTGRAANHIISLCRKGKIN